MGVFDYFKTNGGKATTSTPLTPAEARAISPGFKYIRTWVCDGAGCRKRSGTANPAKLTIRTKTERGDGPSNFRAKDNGHATLTSGELNWNGLAEERGWKVDPHVVCPACQRKISVAEYKSARR